MKVVLTQYSIGDCGSRAFVVAVIAVRQAVASVVVFVVGVVLLVVVVFFFVGVHSGQKEKRG